MFSKAQWALIPPCTTLYEITLFFRCPHIKSCFETCCQRWEKSAYQWVESVYSAFSAAVWGVQQDWQKKRLQELFLSACHLMSVKQSFLIKTEGLGWMSVEFHSRQLKSQETPADQFHSAEQPEPVSSSVAQAAVSPVSATSKTGKKISSSHIRNLTLEEHVWCQRITFNRYSWCYLWCCPKLAEKFWASAQSQYSSAVSADWGILCLLCMMTKGAAVPSWEKHKANILAQQRKVTVTNLYSYVK